MYRETESMPYLPRVGQFQGLYAGDMTGAVSLSKTGSIFRCLIFINEKFGFSRSNQPIGTAIPGV